MGECQGLRSLLKGFVPRIVVAKYEDNTLRTKKKSYDPGTSLRTATPPGLLQYLYFFQKKSN
jgi:hypothetical protein